MKLTWCHHAWWKFVFDVGSMLKLKNKITVRIKYHRFFRDDKTRCLQKTINAYPICKPYNKVKKKIPVLKRKRKCFGWERRLTSYSLTVFVLAYQCAAIFVTFVCITYFASQIYVNLTRDTFPLFVKNE